jgi:hypothetical protein
MSRGSQALAHRAYLRGAIRGGQNLLRSERPFWVIELFLAVREITTSVSKFQTRVLEDLFSISCIENRIRQITTRNDGEICYEFMNNRASGRSISLPFPTELLGYLEGEGVSVNWRESRRKLRRLSRMKIREAIGIFAILIFQVGITRVSGQRTTVFLNVTTKNTFCDDPSRSYSFFGWYRKEFGNNDQSINYVGVNTWGRIRNASGLIQCRFPYPPCPDLRRRLLFSLRSIQAIARAVASSLTGRAESGLLLRDEIEATYLEVVPNVMLPRRYVLDMGDWYQKPLWLETAERRGAEPIVFHYSSLMPVMLHKFPPVPYRYPLPNWRHHVVWTEEAKQLLRHRYKNAQLTMVPYIDYSDSPIAMPERTSDFQVAVFDVPPVRRASSVGLGIPPEAIYYTPDNVLKFSAAIGECAARFPDVTFFFKRKRKVSLERVSQATARQLDEIFQNDRILLLDEDISATRVIEQSDAVISMPFASPGIVGDRLGKPSVFFDPTGLVKWDESSSAPVLGCFEDVCRWLHDSMTAHAN